MPKPEDTARQDTRRFLVMVRDGLGQPPLGAMLAELDGRADL
jgi:hypothetical protein